MERRRDAPENGEPFVGTGNPTIGRHDQNAVRCGFQGGTEQREGITEFRVNASAVTHVPDGGDDLHAGSGVEGSEADLDGKLGAVTVTAEEFHVSPCPAHPRVAGKALPDGLTVALEPHRKQHFIMPAQQLAPRITEKPFGVGIDERDLPVLVDHQQSVGHRFHQVPIGTNVIQRLRFVRHFGPSAE